MTRVPILWARLPLQDQGYQITGQVATIGPGSPAWGKGCHFSTRVTSLWGRLALKDNAYQVLVQIATV